MRLYYILNSQNTGRNTSNVTVYATVQRNDGYAGSAYNGYENQNTATLTVGGVQRVNQHFVLDTRNSRVQELARWTGRSHPQRGRELDRRPGGGILHQPGAQPDRRKPVRILDSARHTPQILLHGFPFIGCRRRQPDCHGAARVLFLFPQGDTFLWNAVGHRFLFGRGDKEKPRRPL